MGKLHDQMRDDLLLKAYSPHTQNAYLRCVRHFVRHYMRSPARDGGEGGSRLPPASNPGPQSLTCHPGHVCQRPQVPLHRYPETT